MNISNKTKTFSCFFIILFLAVLTACSTDLNSTDNTDNQVCFSDKCFYVELAVNTEQKQKGLMFRDFLEEDQGMLFVFDREEIHHFWMKNTLIPLDMIWINENNSVVYIEHNAIPCTTQECEVLTPTGSALYVLEINGGLSEKLNISVGSKADFRLNVKVN